MATDPLAAHATALLLACARGDADAGAQYVELLFPHLRPIVQERPEALLRHAARLVRAPVHPVSQIPQQDRDHLAAKATFEGLSRARDRAHLFDPDRGDGFSWALGATALAYLDVVRKEYGTRRQIQELLVDDEQLARLEIDLPPATTTEEIVEIRHRLEAALATLTDHERYVILAKYQFGLNYSEIAQYRFGDATPTNVKRVDKLLQSARTRLRAAESPSGGAAQPPGTDTRP